MAAAALWIAMRHAGGEAALCKISFPPFARLEADVAAFGEQLGQRWRAANVPEHLTPIGSFRRVVAGHQVLMRIETRDDRHQARPTEARGRVAAGEDDALLRQSIEVRRLNLRMAHEAVIGPALVVGQQDDDVRPSRL